MKNLVKGLICFTFCFLAVSLQAQQTDSTTNVILPAVPEITTYKHSVYAEAFGNAIVGSLNYERLMADKKPGAVVALRVGALFMPFGSKGGNFDYEMLIPIEVTRVYGKKAVKLEYGAGATLYVSSATYSSVDGSFKNEKNVAIAPVLRIGGRWQVPQTPYFIRAGFTPLIISNDYWDIPVVPFGSLSVGYSFGSR